MHRLILNRTTAQLAPSDFLNIGFPKSQKIYQGDKTLKKARNDVYRLAKKKELGKGN